MRRLLLLSILLATSTACMPQPPKAEATPQLPKARATTPFPPKVMRCQEAPGQVYVGQTASDTVVAQAQAATGASSVRLIKPGMAVTMDFRDDRLNLHLDAQGVITQVSCG